MSSAGEINLPHCIPTAEERKLAIDQVAWSGAQGNVWDSSSEAIQAGILCRERQLLAAIRRIAELEQELSEQARINGEGASREAKLLAERDSAIREAGKYERECGRLDAEFASMRDRAHAAERDLQEITNEHKREDYEELRKLQEVSK